MGLPQVKLWDLSSGQPQLLTTKKPHVGSLFTLSFYRDSPFLLVTGGSGGMLLNINQNHRVFQNCVF
jgi:WD40 repeat protein